MRARCGAVRQGLVSMCAAECEMHLAHIDVTGATAAAFVARAKVYALAGGNPTCVCSVASARNGSQGRKANNRCRLNA